MKITAHLRFTMTGALSAVQANSAQQHAAAAVQPKETPHTIRHPPGDLRTEQLWKGPARGDASMQGPGCTTDRDI